METCNNNSNQFDNNIPSLAPTSNVLIGHASDELDEEEPVGDTPVQRRPSIASNVSVRSVLSEHHGTKICTIKDALAVLLIFGIVGLFVWLLSSQSERLVSFAEFVEDIGLFGHFIFFMIFMFVGLPCGYNWSTLVLLVGFSYGWLGLIDANVGTAISSLANYHSSRVFLGKCAQRRIRALGPKKRLYLQAAKHVIEKHKAGFLMLLLIRMQPVLPFGMANTFLGALCRLGIVKYMSSTFIGSQTDIVKLISIAVMVRGAGSLEAATQGEAGTRSVIVTACLTTLVVIGSIVFARYLAVRVLPSLISEDEYMDVDPEDDGLDTEPVVDDGQDTEPAVGEKANENVQRISHDEHVVGLGGEVTPECDAKRTSRISL